MENKKWQEYISRLGTCENQIRLAIRDFREYKKLVFKHRYENERSPYLRRIFQENPNEILDRIDRLKRKIQFCKLKINYYRIICTDGETFDNRVELLNIQTKCNKLLNQFEYLQKW